MTIKSTTRVRAAKNKRLATLMLSSAAAAALIINTPAIAQDEVVGGIEGITVYGEKRETDLQDAKISVTAIPDDLMETANITDASGLNGYVPGLFVNNSGGSEKMVNIRGVGQGTPENFSTQPGVSFHIDGVYLPNSIALNMGFFDVERVEVLRGPQGTVFGQSSTGGTLNVITKKPILGEYGAEAKFTYGDYDYIEGFGAVNVPIGDSFALRLAGKTHSHEGYAEATSVDGQPGYELDDADNQHFRGVAYWELSENFNVTVGATIYSDDHNGAALKNINDPNPDPRVLTQDHPATFLLDSELYTLGLEYTTGIGVLKFLNSYQNLEHDQSFDGDRLDLATYGGYDHIGKWSTESRVRMHELTLTSLPDSPFEWIVGVFFTDFETEQVINEFLEFGVTEIGDISTLPLTPDTGRDNVTYANIATADRISWAPFFQATFDLTDKLDLTLGARYNKDEYDGTSVNFSFAPPWQFDFDNISFRESETEVWTGKAALSYDLTLNNMLYASWSRGYKPGGTNPGAFGDAQPEFEPEIVETFEIGSKNLFLNDTLRLNGTAFYSYYDDTQYIQESEYSFSGGIGNIPESEIWGIELEGLWLLFGDRLQLDGNYAWLDGEIKSDFLARDRQTADAATWAAGFNPFSCFFGDCLDVRLAATTQVQGNEPAHLADTFRLGATWFQPVANFGELTARAEFLSVGEYESRIFNTAGLDQTPGYEQVNLHFGLQPNVGPWSASFAVINVGDEDGINGRFVDPYSSTQTSNQYIPPRQWLLTVGLEF